MAASTSCLRDEYDSLEDLIRAQKKEVRALNDQKRVQVKRASKKDQSKVEAEWNKKISELEEKHKQQQEEYNAGDVTGASSSPTFSSESVEPVPNSTALEDVLGDFKFEVRQAPSKSNQRRQKKLAQEKERRAEIDLLNSQQVNHKQIEIDAIQSQLTPLQLVIHYIKADGDCLFSSVNHQLALQRLAPDMASLDIPAYSVSALRKLAVDYMQAHADDFAPFIHDEEATSFDDYLFKMANTSVWGSQLELQALSHQLKVTFIIYNDGTPIHIGREQFPSTNPLSLTFHRHFCALGDHYNSVVPKS